MKPTIGVVYSDASPETSQARLLAFYLAGCLLVGGYSVVKFVNFSSSDSAEVSQTDISISVIIPGSSAVRNASSSDYHFGKGDSLKDCHVLLVFIERICSTKMSQWLADSLPKKSKLPVFIVSSDIRAASDFVSGLSTNSLNLLQAVPAFTVFEQISGNSHLYSSLIVSNPSLVIERLPKRCSDETENILGLLTSSNIPILFRKSLNQHTWGYSIVSIFESLCFLVSATPAVAINDVLMRKIFSQVLFEISIGVKQIQANSWSPDLSSSGAGVSSIDSLMLQLSCPSIITIISSYFNYFPRYFSACPSSMTVDVANGRISRLQYSIGEMLLTIRRLSVDTPVLDMIFKLCLGKIMHDNPGFVLWSDKGCELGLIECLDFCLKNDLPLMRRIDDDMIIRSDRAMSEIPKHIVGMSIEALYDACDKPKGQFRRLLYVLSFYVGIVGIVLIAIWILSIVGKRTSFLNS